jgi:hypothetical protein
MVRRLRWLLLLASVGLVACLDPGGPEGGIAPTPAGDGPTVVFDLDAKPLPEIPFPIDLAARPDEDSPTGLRVNISLRAPTLLERRVREKAQQMTGFGTFAPMWVRFDRPINAAAVRAAHAGKDAPGPGDAIYVINIDPSSRRFRQATPLDMGNGHFPIVLERRDAYFEGDPRGGSSNLLFDTYDEDTNGDGVLGPGEDTDGDGVLDRGNSYPAGGHDVDDLLDFYETETNTLLIRVIEPLAQRAKHAVVLTRRIVGLDGEPIRSPFPWVNHARQSQDLSSLPGILAHAELGVTVDEIAFAWTFTTQDVTGDLEALRAGLYGHGPFAQLATEYPADLDHLHPLVPEDSGMPNAGNAYVMEARVVEQLAGPILNESLGLDVDEVDALKATLAYVDYFFSGVFLAPDLLADKDGIASEDHPADEDEAWDIDPGTGRIHQRPGEVRFWCLVPKAKGTHRAPFPVTYVAHGYGSTRSEMLIFAGSIAKFGMASCGLDAPGHGLPTLDPDDAELVEGLVAQFGLLDMFHAFQDGSARDLNNNGAVESGGDQWTADVFHTRDTVRQSVLWHMALTRILRSFDGERRWKLDLDGVGGPDLAGDFNTDGTVDIGGSQAYFATGGSLGGITSSILSGIEPAIVAGAPVAGGAGLVDIGIRSSQRGVPEAVVLRMMGPIVLIRGPGFEGARDLLFLVPDVADAAYLPFATLPADLVQEGDWLEVENLDNGEVRGVPIPAATSTRAHIPADADTVSLRRHRLGLRPVELGDAAPPSVPPGTLLGDRMVVRVRDPAVDGDAGIRVEIDTFERPVTYMGATWPEGATLVAPAEGFGHRRGTPELRRFFAIAQAILEPGDPAGYAPHHSIDPLNFDYDPGVRAGAHMLFIPTIGDMSVPASTGIAMARASGVLSPWQHRDLISERVVEGIESLMRHTNSAGDVGVLFDADNLSAGRDGFDVPRFWPGLRATIDDGLGGLSALRMPYMRVDGQHGFGSPSPNKAFDIDTYMINSVGRFFETQGAELIDHPCLEDNSCDFILPPP